MFVLRSLHDSAWNRETAARVAVALETLGLWRLWLDDGADYAGGSGSWGVGWLHSERVV